MLSSINRNTFSNKMNNSIDTNKIGTYIFKFFSLKDQYTNGEKIKPPKNPYKNTVGFTMYQK